MVDARKSLWRFASSTPKENKDLLATPLPKRIAARKLQRNAQNAVLQELGTMQQNKTNQKIIKENAPQAGHPDPAHAPAFMRAQEA